ncbi:MAG TPA: IS66 family transposase [Planctomycetota bacterium]
MDFSKERSVTYLRAVAQLQYEKISHLERELLELRARVGETETVVDENKTLVEMLARARQREFGRSSERRPSEKPPKQPRAPQPGHGPRKQPNLETEIIEHPLPEDVRVCPACGGELTEVEGLFDESELITVTVRNFVRQLHRQKKYRCRCNGCIKTAPGPLRLLDGGRFSVEFAAEAAASKYSEHLPLTRQARIMGYEGLVTDSQTLWDQVNALATLLTPTYEAIIKVILAFPVIGCDETRWYLLDNGGKVKENRIWQSWCLMGHDLVAYRIMDSRGRDAAAEVLAGFTGVVMADAYTVYQSLARLTGLFVVAFCWAHVRRRFVECQDNFPTECGEALTMIKALYAVEREGKIPDADLAVLRDQKSRPIVDAIFIWAKALAARELPRSGLGEALGYLLNQEVGLRRFLDDSRIPIDNNATEAAQRGVVLGRNNHLGSRSRRGTEVAAIYYTLVECAKLAGVSPKSYIIAVATAARLNSGAVLLPADFKTLLSATPTSEPSDNPVLTADETDRNNSP